jgi:endonuclease/exonuclease/phosphatase family metal-dependent hydrolase
MNTARRRLTAALLPVFALAALTVGCAATADGPGGRIAVDGDLSEWRGGGNTIATADAVYFRFSPGERATIQANDETTRLVFDLDDSPATGKPLPGPPEIGTLGVDLEILLSPPVSSLSPSDAERVRSRAMRDGGPAPELASGVNVLRHEGPAAFTRLGHADVGFVAGPTYSSEWYEARLDRHAPALAGTGLDSAGNARGVVLVTDGAGRVVRYSDPLIFVLPERNSSRRPSNAGVPPQPPGTVRVLSMNVLRGKPATEPAPFARLIAAVQPDVVLLQEADDFDAERLEAWLSGFVGVLPAKHGWSEGVQSLAGGVGAWDAVALPDQGVAIATPHVITGRYDDPIEIADPDSGSPRTVRAVAAMVSTPLGDVLALSTHLKCCGSDGSSEDRIRAAEVAAINARFGAIADAAVAGEGRRIAARIIGGDLNLVGSRGPLEELAEGLAGTGGDLDARLDADPRSRRRLHVAERPERLRPRAARLVPRGRRAGRGLVRDRHASARAGDALVRRARGGRQRRERPSPGRGRSAPLTL